MRLICSFSICIFTCSLNVECLRCLPALEFDNIGDNFVFIGAANTEIEYFDWFDARRSCRAMGGQLASVETAEQMRSLQKYILAQGYHNGSIFSTSGHSFLSPYPYKWDSLQEPVTYTKWLADDPVPSTFLSLQLVDSELYMVTSSGYDDYYICEYRPQPQYLCFLSSLRTSLLICLPLILIVILLVKIIHLTWPKRQNEVGEKPLLV